jgi:hypothetical protein
VKTYSQQLIEVIQSALEEVAAGHASGKLANTPVSNTNYLLRWVTKSIKEQRFSKTMVKDLTAWQKLGRSQGSKTALYDKFQTMAQFYGFFFPQPDQPQPVLDAQIEQLMDVMEGLGWSVSNEYDLTGKGVAQIYTEGDSSFALCSDQCDSCFEDGGAILTKPMSFYVRGHHAQFIQQATAIGLMLHKQTDYKSKVKYHGEYIIYPNNQGNQIGEIPLDFNFDDYTAKRNQFIEQRNISE